MKNITLTIAAVSLAISLAAIGTANAETRYKTAKPMPTNTIQMKKIVNPASAGSQNNSGPAWTAGCIAEFGPDAKYPDAAMLEKCLNW